MAELRGISDQLLGSLVPDALGSFDTGLSSVRQNVLGQQGVTRGEQGIVAGQQNIDLTQIKLAQGELNAKGQEANALLTAETPEQLRAMLVRRAQELTTNPVPGVEAEDLIDMANRLGEPNGFQTIQAELKGDIARIKDISAQLSAAEREFQSLTAGLSDAEKLEARRIKLGLDPRAVGTGASTIADQNRAAEVAEAERVLAAGKATGAAQGRADVDIIEQPRLTTAVEEAKVAVQIPAEERKLTQTANIKRITELGQASKSREASRKKARTFLRAFKSGTAESGATRTGLSFVPGVFTSQAQFDEKFNAFAEVAARQTLKASGELRPTDADVKGMKEALFGVGRDEVTNIELLEEFINDLDNQDDELEDLRGAKASGNLSTFTGAPPVQGDLSTMSNENLLDF